MIVQQRARNQSLQASLSSNQQNGQLPQMQPSTPSYRSMMPPSNSYPPTLSAPAKIPVPPLAAEKSESSKGLKRKREDNAKKKEEIYQNIHRMGLEAFNECHTLIDKISEELERGSIKQGRGDQLMLSTNGFGRLKRILSARKKKLSGPFPEMPVSCSSDKSAIKKRKIQAVDKSVLKYPKLCEDLAQLIDNEEISDVIFIVEGEEIHAHTSIISTRSKWFHTLFFHGFLEGLPEKLGEKKKIKLEECYKDEFRVILNYLYTGKLYINNQSLLRLYALAHRFNLEEMETLCAKHLEEILTDENTLPLLLESYEMHLDETPCGEVIFRSLLIHCELLLGDFIFNESNLFPVPLMIKLLKNDYFTIDKQNTSENEFAICLFAHQWLSLSPPNEDVRQTIKSLIRLDLMEVSQRRNLKRLTDCIFDSDAHDKYKVKEDRTDVKIRRVHPLSLLGGIAKVYITKEELFITMFIQFDRIINTSTPIGKWNNLDIYLHIGSKVTLDNLDFFFSFLATPETFTGDKCLVEANIEIVSPRFFQDSLLLTPQILNMSREQNKSILNLKELLTKELKLSELINNNNGLTLQIRLNYIKN